MTWVFAILVSAISAGMAAVPDLEYFRGLFVCLAVWLALGAVIIEIRNVGRSVRGEPAHE